MGVAAALSVRVSANIGDFTKEIDKLERSFDKFGSRLQNVGTKLTTGVTLPIIAVAGAAVKAAADFEESFSGISKTVDGVAKSNGQLTAFGKQLQDQFRQLAKTLPVSVHELNKIGEAAGAMGIPKERIVDFTKSIAMLASTTDLTADQAAMSVGKIQGMYGSLGEDTDRFSSSLVALGNAGKSFESTIVRAAERMSSTGVQAKISQDALLGWASAISDISAGGNIELTTTAWNKLVSVMDKAVDLGGGKLDAFAKIASLGGTEFTSGGFAQLFNQDASAAVLAFVQGMGQVEAQGGNLTKVLEDMGLKTSGVQTTLKALAAISPEVARQLKLSAEEWQKNSAMTEEFNKKSSTTISQLKMLFNRLYDVGISLGQVLIPAFMRMAPAANTVLEVLAGLVVAFSNLPQPIQLAVMGFFGIAAAIGPVLLAFGTLTRAAAGLLDVFKLLGGAKLLEVLAPSFNAARAAIIGFSSAALAIPGVQVAAAVAGIGIAVGLLIPKLSDAVREFGFLTVAKDAFIRGAMATPLGSLLGGGGPSARSTRPGAGMAPGRDINLPDEVAQMAAQIKNQQRLQAELQKRFPELNLSGAAKPKKTDEDREREAFQKEMDRLTGSEALKTADEWRKKVALIGGASKLAAKDQKAFADALFESATAMQRGLIPADGMLSTLQEWVRLQKGELSTGLTKRRNPITGIWEDAQDSIGIITKLSDTTLREMTKIETVQALAARLAAQAPPQLALTEPEIMTSMSPDSFRDMKELPGFFARALGSAKEFGANLSGVLMDAFTGGGNAGKSVGAFLGGSLFGELGKKLTSSMSGMLGGLLGGIMGPLGSMLGSMLGPLFDKLAGLFGNRGRDLVKDFAAGFGGFDAMHNELLKMGSAGEALWVKLTQGVGRNNPEQAKKVIEEVTKAMEAYKQAVSDITGGVNARAANVTTQGDADVVSAGAAASFALQLQQGVSAAQALASLEPALTALREALASGNIQLSAAGERMLYLSEIVTNNKIQFDNLAASGQMLNAMLQGNIMSGTLFAAVSSDIGAQIQAIIDRGVPMAEAFALSAPQLQSLWEAQQRWGFAVDETTAKLLAEAEAQGFVGEHMRSANEKILQVLIAIGDVLGATIPDALRGLPAHAQAAADGMNNAFSGVRPPRMVPDTGSPGGEGQFGVWDWRNEYPDGLPLEGVPAMGTGGIVRGRPGGTFVRVGEGGRDEAIVPMPASGVARAGGGTAILEIDGVRLAEIIVPHQPGVVRRYGLG